MLSSPRWMAHGRMAAGRRRTQEGPLQVPRHFGVTSILFHVIVIGVTPRPSFSIAEKPRKPGIFFRLLGSQNEKASKQAKNAKFFRRGDLRERYGAPPGDPPSAGIQIGWLACLLLHVGILHSWTKHPGTAHAGSRGEDRSIPRRRRGTREDQGPKKKQQRAEINKNTSI